MKERSQAQASLDEPISPELVLVSPDLRQRLQALGAIDGTPRWLRPNQREGVAAEAFAAYSLAQGVELADRWRSLAPAAAAALVGLLGGTLALAPTNGQPSRVVPDSRLTPTLSKQHPILPSPRRPTSARPESRPLSRIASQKAPPRRTTRSRHLARALAVPELEPSSSLVGPPPDPTPPKLRLRPTVARALLAISRRRGVDWPLLLAAARTHDLHWTRVRPSRLDVLARRLRRERAQRFLASPQEATLARYFGAVGLDPLVSGLRGARSVLAARVLRDPNIRIYPGGRSDIAAGRVDVRVLALLLYLARSEGSVAVSSLVSGHARPGDGRERSSHAFGVAVDLAAIAGRPVYGHQSVSGPVARAIRDMLLLPREVRPLQIISLLALGGPSLALADHDRVVHVGFDPTVGTGSEGMLGLLWRSAGARYGVPWQVLAAINEIETKNGTFLHVSPAGAVGWMQFMPATWERYGFDADGNGRADPWNPADAIFSAARYLAASGAATDLRGAIWDYNHAGWYVDDVLYRAARIERATG